MLTRACTATGSAVLQNIYEPVPMLNSQAVCCTTDTSRHTITALHILQGFPLTRCAASTHWATYLCGLPVSHPLTYPHPQAKSKAAAEASAKAEASANAGNTAGAEAAATAAAEASASAEGAANAAASAKATAVAKATGRRMLSV